ncbi:MAG: hypothetical protein ACERKN_06650 [Velocimicrobium sp.]
MGKKNKVRGLFVLVLLMAAPHLLYEPSVMASQIESKETQYSLANQYYKIKSLYNGKYLLGNRAGYEAQAENESEAMTFYLKPSALGIYILYDKDSKWLNVNLFKAIIRNTSRQKSIQWRINPESGESFSLYSITEKKYISISGTSLVWKNSVDHSCLFVFEDTTGNNPFKEADTCVTLKGMDGSTVEPQNAMSRPNIGDRIIGYADTHGHINHFLGSGQVTFVMEPFNPLGIEEALNSCAGWHGNGGSLDLWGAAVDNCVGHNTNGYPDFDYWPTSYSTNHQQVYYKWLERSWLAGQRVFVQQCVNNEILGTLMNTLPPYKNAPTDDMVVANLQIQNMLDMQDYIDAQCGGPGKGWFRIVTSANEAREVISKGKMAVFLSLELDTVFGVKEDYIGQYEAGIITKADCDAKLEAIESQLNQFYDKGVRSIFVVHALNNGFGGCQLYQGEIFSIMNYLNRGDFYQPEVSTNPRVFYKQPKANLSEEAQGHGNTMGLTKTGEWLIKKLIAKRFVIEVDHMSDKTFNQTLDIVWNEKYPGIIASHTRILDMFQPADEAWEQMDIPRMIKVMQLGGIISPMLWETLNQHQRCVADYLTYMIELSNGGVPAYGVLDNEVYQTYGGPYKVPTTWYNTNDNPNDDIILGIPYGSDVNGACMLPNFDNCSGVYDLVNYDDGSFGSLYPGVYDSTVNESSVQFLRQKTGNRTFDINGDRGVAHYGLIPDLLKKFESRPDRVNMEATFNSAEAYIRMLERVENYSDSYPTRDAVNWVQVDTEYWH